MIPFCVFFSDPIKFVSIFAYIIGFVGGPLFFRIKNARRIKKRLEIDESERIEQEKREHGG